MKAKFHIFFISIILGSSLAAADLDSTWTLKKSQNGIDVYIRNFEDKAGFEFHATITIEDSLHRIKQTIFDVNNVHLWQDKVEGAECISDTINSCAFIRNKIEMPWPYKNRDLIVTLKQSTDSLNAETLYYKSAYNKQPIYEGYERLKYFYGFWKLNPITDSKTEITYQFYSNPEISLPDWLMKMFIVDGPYTTLKQLKEYQSNQD